MYKEYLKIKPNKLGKGVYTNVQIPANIPILEFRGLLLSESEVTEHDRSLQVGADLFLGPSGDVDDYIKHSCNPNCYVHATGKRAILYSLYLIQPDSELTFDYALTSTSNMDQWNMDCKCDDYSCRKVISGYQHMNWETQQMYEKKGITPIYIGHSEMFPKKT